MRAQVRVWVWVREKTSRREPPLPLRDKHTPRCAAQPAQRGAERPQRSAAQRNAHSVEEARDDVPRVVEHESDVYVLRALGDGRKVLSGLSEIHPDLSYGRVVRDSVGDERVSGSPYAGVGECGERRDGRRGETTTGRVGRRWEAGAAGGAVGWVEGARDLALRNSTPLKALLSSRKVFSSSGSCDWAVGLGLGRDAACKRQ